MKVKQPYLKIIAYLKDTEKGITIDHDEIVKVLQQSFGRKAVMSVETSCVYRVRQLGFRDAKSAVEITLSKECPKDLGG